MVGKTQRQHRIGLLLEHNAVSTQEQLVELLSTDGVEATQATVSRDLEELGAIKVRVAGGEPVYALPELPSKQLAPRGHLRRVLGDWVVELSWSLNLVVLRTPPGSAHVVGSALDRSGFAGIVGTVAGDDTVLVVASEDVGGRVLADRLKEVAGFEEGLEGGALSNKRVVLAYSGGLDTSVAVRWLEEESGSEVIALAVDVGPGRGLRGPATPRDRSGSGRIRRSRRACRDGRQLRRTRDPGERKLRRKVPARLRSVASCHRQASGCWPRGATGRMPSHMDARARATIRSGSRSGRAPSHLISRSSPPQGSGA